MLRMLRKFIHKLLGIQSRIESMEERILDLERDMFFLERQVVYFHKHNHEIKTELGTKISYDEFDKFERHIARLEQIFA